MMSNIFQEACISGDLHVVKYVALSLTGDIGGLPEVSTLQYINTKNNTAHSQIEYPVAALDIAPNGAGKCK